MMALCGDEFVVVLHEMSFFCNLEKGHQGPHRCREITFEDVHQDGARKRQVVYGAEWSDKKLFDQDHLLLQGGRLVRAGDVPPPP